MAVPASENVQRATGLKVFLFVFSGAKRVKEYAPRDQWCRHRRGLPITHKAKSVPHVFDVFWHRLLSKHPNSCIADGPELVRFTHIGRFGPVQKLCEELLTDTINSFSIRRLWLKQLENSSAAARFQEQHCFLPAPCTSRIVVERVRVPAEGDFNRQTGEAG